MEIACRYAYAGHEWVLERVRKIIGGAVTVVAETDMFSLQPPRHIPTLLRLA
jgi:hypothetical protein